METNWNDLTDDNKTSAMREFIKRNGLDNFDYNEQRNNYEKMKQDNGKCHSSIYPTFKNPCLILKLIDPVLTYTVMSWLYTKSNEFNVHIPFMGYELSELIFDKSALVSYSENEREILCEAMKILQSKCITEK